MRKPILDILKCVRIFGVIVTGLGLR